MTAVQWKNGHCVCRVDALRIGQRVDLQCDVIADPEGYALAQDGEGTGTLHPEFESEFETVATIECETADCIAVSFESGFTCGFPPDHEVDVDGEQDEAEMDAAEAEARG